MNLKSIAKIETAEPTVVSLTDYYPFGMTEPGRSWNAGDYRFGYTGHEKENDLAEGVYTTEYRLLDTRLGRWMSVDPLFGKYPGMSSYNYCGGNPVIMVDMDGRYFNDENEEKASEIQDNLLAKMGELYIQKGKTEDENEKKALDERISALNYTYMGIEEMRNDQSREYQYHNSKTPGTIQEGDVVHMNIFEGNEGSAVHESTHGGDFARNILTNENHSFSHEVKAYRAQVAYDGKFSYLPYRTYTPVESFNMMYAIKEDRDGWLNKNVITITKMDEVNEYMIQSMGELNDFNTEMNYIYPTLRLKSAQNIFFYATINNKLKPSDKYYYLHRSLMLYLRALVEYEKYNTNKYDRRYGVQ